MPKGAIHYTGTNFPRLRRLDIVHRVRVLEEQKLLHRPKWLTYAERAPPLELGSLLFRTRRVQNKYISLTRDLLQKYPDVRFQDCFVEGNSAQKGEDFYRSDHPVMQFVALQLKFMNKGVSKSRSFKMAEDAFRERRRHLERMQKIHMATAVAAAAASDNAAAAATNPDAPNQAINTAAIPTSSRPRFEADGVGFVQPMFTTGMAYSQMQIASAYSKHLQRIRSVLKNMREEAQLYADKGTQSAANSGKGSLNTLRQRTFLRRQRHHQLLQQQNSEEPAVSFAEATDGFASQEDCGEFSCEVSKDGEEGIQGFHLSVVRCSPTNY